MCRKKPGLRCASQAYDSLNCRQEKLAEAQAELEAYESAFAVGEVNQNPTTSEEKAELAEIKAERARLSDRVVRLTNEMEQVELEYHMSPAGLIELQEQTNDESLSEAERDEAKEKLAVAQAERTKRKNAYSREVIRQEKLVSVLSDAGVDDETIEIIRKQAASDKGNPHIRSMDDYEESLEVADKELDAAKKASKKAKGEHETAVAAVFKKGTKQGWTQEETNAEVTKVDESFAKVHKSSAKREKAAKDKVHKAQAAVDSHVKGQAKLRELYKATKTTEYQKRSELKYRLSTAQKTYRDGMSDRKAKEILREQIKEAMKAQGKSPKAALDALKVRGSAVGDRRPGRKPTHEFPEMRKTGLSTHLTEAEVDRAQDAFKRSSEYKNNGEAGYNAFVVRHLMQDPKSRHKGSVDDANAKAESFDKGVPRRHKTSQAGKRSESMTLTLTYRDRKVLSERAETFHMTLSSYVRAMYPKSGVDPYAIQNDRSHRVNLTKTVAMKRLEAETAKS